MGHISKACKKVGINRWTYYDWLKKSEFKQALDEAVEGHNDIIHKNILEMAQNKDKDMMKFWAKTQMKHRGFIETQHLEHSGTIDYPTEINITPIKKKKKKK